MQAAFIPLSLFSMIACTAGAEPSRDAVPVNTNDVAVDPHAQVESAAGDVCPSAGPCCESHPGVGCGDPLCCEQVCSHTPFCCEGLWTQECAGIAAAVCDVCDTPFTCPQTGDCCTDHAPDGGCEREFCCDLVCGRDSYCCDGEWDNICANIARANCPNICVCDSFGDFDVSATLDLVDVASLLTCFTGAGNSPVAPGCECADYDGDGDADLNDFAVFHGLLPQ